MGCGWEGECWNFCGKSRESSEFGSEAAGQSRRVALSRRNVLRAEMLEDSNFPTTRDGLRVKSLWLAICASTVEISACTSIFYRLSFAQSDLLAELIEFTYSAQTRQLQSKTRIDRWPPNSFLIRWPIPFCLCSQRAGEEATSIYPKDRVIKGRHCR
ncbi:hypothetical protein BC567DRAFT_224015 [Phyllosticta citribraziliensis]